MLCGSEGCQLEMPCCTAPTAQRRGWDLEECLLAHTLGWGTGPASAHRIGGDETRVISPGCLEGGETRQSTP